MRGRNPALMAARRHYNGIAACVVRCACDPSPDGTGGDTVVDHIRLFPLRDDVRFTYRVHEQVLPSINRARIPVRWTDLTIRHTAELWFRKGVIHRYRGESMEAESSWLRILGLTRPKKFCSVDQGIYGHLTWRNLAVLAAERGDLAEAEKRWRAVLAECPGDPVATAQLERLARDRRPE